jgi:hypothetical protein
MGFGFTLVLLFTEEPMTLKFALVALAACFLSACATPLTNQKMFWKPTNDTKDFDASGLAKYKFKILPFSDERRVTPRNKIAENTENETPRAVLADTDNMSPFVTENIEKTLSASGLEIVSSGESYQISGAIKDLFVNESNLYKGTVTIRYIVKKGGKEVYNEIKTGSSKRFGRSYKMENYMESISDALVDSLMKFLNDSALKSALKH